MEYGRLKLLESAPHAETPETTLRSIRDMLAQACGDGQCAPELGADPDVHPDTARPSSGASGGAHPQPGVAPSLMRRLFARFFQPD